MKLEKQIAIKHFESFVRRRKSFWEFVVFNGRKKYSDNYFNNLKFLGKREISDNFWVIFGKKLIS